MIVTVNYEKQLREAYQAGAAAMALYLANKRQPKPDADAYIKREPGVTIQAVKSRLRQLSQSPSP